MEKLKKQREKEKADGEKENSEKVYYLRYLATSFFSRYMILIVPTCP